MIVTGLISGGSRQNDYHFHKEFTHHKLAQSTTQCGYDLWDSAEPQSND